MEEDEWTKEVKTILERVRVNSINLSEYHRMRYYYYKGFSKYFDIPVLILSTLSGSFSVGTQAYLEQSIISVVSCVISMLITVITSIKLYLNIQDTLQVELAMSKEFYTLAIDIYKVLSLPNNLKGEKGLSYLNNKYSLYNKLVEASDLLQKKNKNDQLIVMNKEFVTDFNRQNSTNTDDNSELKNKNELPIVINTPKENYFIDPITVYNATQNLDKSNKYSIDFKEQLDNQIDQSKQQLEEKMNKQLDESNHILEQQLDQSKQQLEENMNKQLEQQLDQSKQLLEEKMNKQLEQTKLELENRMNQQLQEKINQQLEQTKLLEEKMEKQFEEKMKKQLEEITKKQLEEIKKKQLEETTQQIFNPIINKDESLDKVIALFESDTKTKKNKKK